MYPVGAGRGSRCHLHERAHELPRVTPRRSATSAPRPQPAMPLLRANDVSKTFRIVGNRPCMR